MGSYNMSCALSNLPILPNDEIKILFLVENTGTAQLNSGAFWVTLLPCFLDATYNDCGNYTLDVPEYTLDALREIFEEHGRVSTTTGAPVDAQMNNKEYFENIFRQIESEDVYMTSTYLDNVCSIEHEFENHKTYYTSMRPRKVKVMAVRKSIIDSMCVNNICTDVPDYKDGEMHYKNLTLDNIINNDVIDSTVRACSSFFISNLLVSYIYESTLTELELIGLSEADATELRDKIVSAIQNPSEPTDLAYVYKFIVNIDRLNESFNEEYSSTLIRYLNYESVVYKMVDMVDAYDIDREAFIQMIVTCQTVFESNRRTLYYDMSDIKGYSSLVKQNLYNSRILTGFLTWLSSTYNGYLKPSVYVNECGDIQDHYIMYDIFRQEADIIKESYNE